MKKHIYKKSDFDFWTRITTRWGDMDGLRHINHAAYLSYTETARLDYFNHLGFNFQRWNHKSSTILVSANIDYIQQITHPATLEIGQRIVRIGRTSFDILTGVFTDQRDIPLFQGIFTLVTYDYKLKKPTTVPAEFRIELREMD